jgi:hypothetical protein
LPDGKQKPFAPGLNETANKLGISGLAAGADSTLYVACNSTVMKVKRDGSVTKLAGPMDVKECDLEYPDNNPKFPMPGLRGLAVDSHGIVYAAAGGCHCMVKITPDGKVENVLKADRPWTPTGVAVSDNAIYVLEYTNANTGADKGWHPRVRKLGRDGTVKTLASIPK